MSASRAGGEDASGDGEDLATLVAFLIVQFVPTLDQCSREEPLFRKKAHCFLLLLWCSEFIG
jgi:hypothetical protein